MNTTNVPTRKVAAAGVGSVAGAALGTVVNYLLVLYLGHQDSQSTQELVTAAATLIVTLLSAYFVPPGNSEGIIQTANGPRSAR